MSDPNFMALALTVPKTVAKSVNCKKSRLNADGGVNIYSSRCMHDPSFMALALKVSEKMT